MKILFTGGGTGGHLFPVIAIARELKRLSQDPSISLHYIGPADRLGSAVLAQENIAIHSIVAGKLRNYFSLQNISDALFFIPLGFLQSFFLLLFIRPNLVFSKGGTGSAQVVLAARILAIPIFIHESDSVAGRANKLAYSWAKKVFASFEKTDYFDPSKSVVVGNPILKEITEGDKKTAKDIFNLALQKPVLLFLGGSQGAQPINDFILGILQDLTRSYQVIHVCGKKNETAVKEESDVILTGDAKAQYHVFGFLNEIELKHAFAVADLVVSRGGSGSIFEIAACGKPSIIIPLPSSANNHQAKNAYAYAKNGAALIIEQDNLTPNFFLEKLRNYFSHPEELESMSQAALQFAKPLAAKAIAREILEFLNA